MNDPDTRAEHRPLARAAAVIVGAGSSKRMARASETPVRKPLLRLLDRTVIEHACAAFEAAPSIVELVLVGHPDDLAALRRMVSEARIHHPDFAKVRAVVPGGRERTDSVRAGVEAVSSEVDVICVHDAARPLVSSAIVERAIAVAAREGAALVAVPVRDTLKTSPSGHGSESTLDRSSLWAAQTPQCFQAERLRGLLKNAERDGFRPTDEAALHERYLGPVPLVEGDPHNLKLTTQEDLALAEAVLRCRRTPVGTGEADMGSARVGLGFDVHRLVEGRPCMLGGVRLDHPKGPLGHSDGDAVLHALADAILGAAGLEDLGTLFSDRDPQWKDADSARLLEAALGAVHAAGWRVVNADVVIATEGPRIAPYRAAMRKRLGELLAIGAERVNVKGKTFEGLGAIAASSGVAVQAVCLLESTRARDSTARERPA